MMVAAQVTPMMSTMEFLLLVMAQRMVWTIGLSRTLGENRGEMADLSK